MKIRSLLLTVIISLTALTASADEGMWLLNMIGKNYKQMKAQGFRLKPEDVYSIKKSSLKDAVVNFGGYCTGEIVSEQGLLFTNHHCGYESIQQHSSVDQNYLKDGFWAKTLQDEIPTPGLYVQFMQEIRDVTDQVLKGVTPKMTENERQRAIRTNSDALKEAAQKEFTADYYDIVIKPFFSGNAYYMVIYINYEDVRFVGAGPESIGKFGHDTDNWMWPRHTGDFSIFRVYMAPDGTPASYSEKNVPLKPKHFLPISIAGYKEGDFAMTIGFPGSTERHSTSYEIVKDMQNQNSITSYVRGIRQDIMKADMEADEAVRIKYATKYSHSSNYWKKFIEANKSLKEQKTVEEKQAQERAFMQWVNANPARKAEYGTVLDSIKYACDNLARFEKIYYYVLECVLNNGMEFFNPAYFAMQSMAKIADTEEIRAKADEFFKDYNKPTDYKVSKAMIKTFLENVTPAEIEKYFGNEISSYFTQYDNPENLIDSVFINSSLLDKDGFYKFLDDTSALKRLSLQFDPAFEFSRYVLNIYFALNEYTEKYENLLGAARRRYTKGSIAMNPKALTYPDANFTERLSYGTVQTYVSRTFKPEAGKTDGVIRTTGDGVLMNYFCTLKGVMEKEIPGDYEFDVSPLLKELYNKKDYGRYADKDGTMHVCFLTNNDITGGNSGSPVIDGYGRLIGLAFDGNSESMCSDWIFNSDFQRCINVDIRYVLFVIEKYGQAQRLIDELKIEM